jgi:hypothetical protein
MMLAPLRISVKAEPHNVYHEVTIVPFFLFFCRNTFNQSNPFDRRCPYLGTVDVTVPETGSSHAIAHTSQTPTIDYKRHKIINYQKKL